jgi:lipoprotein-anchoring transpeptidase ErfK/SrfK
MPFFIAWMTSAPMVKSFSCYSLSVAIVVLGSCLSMVPQTIASPVMPTRPIVVQIPELPPLGTSLAEQIVSLDAKATRDAETSPIHLVLRLGERQLYVYRGQETIATYPVAIGRPDTPTPTGEFQIFEMLEDPAWQNPRTGEIEPPGANGSLGTRWMGFANMPNGVIGFHGTPNRASIGSAASHGCVRMRNEDAEALFQQIEVGTIVTVES